ncbi:hypothetical protein EVAR_14173_1 [Eumeta japonica]|uniref:Uncharacterized protein n=1 Tax=Eumeta variegata TaxID=151549 RepID=A0A4C1UFC8_EUMVA|nr:hypothetical protein EVAR_14173_1 [Eumeta japonica]
MRAHKHVFTNYTTVLQQRRLAHHNSTAQTRAMGCVLSARTYGVSERATRGWRHHNVGIIYGVESRQRDWKSERRVIGIENETESELKLGAGSGLVSTIAALLDIEDVESSICPRGRSRGLKPVEFRPTANGAKKIRTYSRLDLGGNYDLSVVVDSSGSRRYFHEALPLFIEPARRRDILGVESSPRLTTHRWRVLLHRNFYLIYRVPCRRSL